MAGRKTSIMLLPSHSHTSIEMNAINPANTFQVPQLGIYNARVYEFVMERLVQRRPRGAQLQNRAGPVGTTSIEIDGWNRNRRDGPVIDKRADRHAHRHHATASRWRCW